MCELRREERLLPVGFRVRDTFRRAVGYAELVNSPRSLAFESPRVGNRVSDSEHHLGHPIPIKGVGLAGTQAPHQVGYVTYSIISGHDSECPEMM